MHWEDFELHATVNTLPLSDPVGIGYTNDGIDTFRRIDRRIGGWYHERRHSIDGLYIFHYRDAIADAARIQHAAVTLPPAPFSAEFLRLRFRPAADADPAQLSDSFRTEVLEPLSAGPGPALKGWSTWEGYSARDDVGARYGDLARGIDPTEIVVRMLTANTELRFFLLEHPGFLPNHDIAHLYLSTMGLTLAQEAGALRQCIERVETWNARFRERLAQPGP